MTATTGARVQSEGTIAIVGAGFAGTMVGVHLLKRASSPLRITLIERYPEQFCRGVAYSTRERCHLLNVGAGNMSAFPDYPDDFLQWALDRKQRLADFLPGDEISPHTFLTRHLYGEYLHGVFEQALGGARPGVELAVVYDEVIDIVADDAMQNIELRSGNTIQAHRVVLALGNFPPPDPSVADDAFYQSARYCRNPWSKGGSPVVGRDETCLMIGSGLTMVDLAIALRERDFRGRIHVVSRHGWLPPVQQPGPESPCRIDFDELPRTVRSLLRWFRAQLRTGQDWRSLISAVRPRTASTWSALPVQEKRRFIRHLRTLWDNHRHQLAPVAAEKLRAMIASDQLTVHAGRVERFVEDEHGVDVTIRLRGSNERKILRVDRVVNCTGSECDYRKLREPLVENLIRRGRVIPDAVAFGLAVSPDGALIDAEGRVSDSLFTLGPPRKGTLWETTAVPEIRVQAQQLAERLLASFEGKSDERSSEAASPVARGDAGVRRLAVLRLAECEEEEAVPELTKALSDSDRDVRLEAVRVLAEFDGPPVVASLLVAIEDPDDAVRGAAADALAEKCDESDQFELLNRLDHSDAFVRAAALRALKPLKLPAALKPAIAALQDDHVGVRREAVGVLGYLQSEAAVPALKDAVHDAHSEVRRAAIKALIPHGIASRDSLKDADWQVRQDAAESVGKVKDRHGFDALLAALEDDHWQVRQKAAWSLGQLGDPRAIPVLGSQLLSHPESNVRKEAAAALGAIGHADGEIYLQKASADCDADVRKSVRLALQMIGKGFAARDC
ncbi:HEAT repeat domain-containing protein [Methylocaldum szegediense]|uniref:HEAT repeat domain-containing protein n=1 Tax=Methylocaldum szegediense TaxID=73780 RepID=UPI000411D981|nr:HEAT repeat domain-containing protein [Methylocaldum szegediense]